MHKTATFFLTYKEMTPVDEWGNQNNITDNLSASFFTIEEALKQAQEMYDTGAFVRVALMSKNTKHRQNTWVMSISEHGVGWSGNTFLYHAERSAEDPTHIFSGYMGDYAEEEQTMAPATLGERYPYTVEECTLRRNKYGFEQ